MTLKYLVEERKISERGKNVCVCMVANYGQTDCLKYLVEEAKVPLNIHLYVSYARYFEHTECENYLLEKGCPEPTDEEYRFLCRGSNQITRKGAAIEKIE